MLEIDRNILGLLVLFGSNVDLSDELMIWVAMGNEDMLVMWFLVVVNGQSVICLGMVLCKQMKLLKD